MYGLSLKGEERQRGISNTQYVFYYFPPCHCSENAKIIRNEQNYQEVTVQTLTSFSHIFHEDYRDIYITLIQILNSFIKLICPLASAFLTLQTSGIITLFRDIFSV